LVSPVICVIVPVYGNWEDTLECLKALELQSNTGFQILIADDGSPVPPPPEIHELKRTRYFRAENVGFGRNCNRAASKAIAEGATHLLFLNSDTKVGPDFMDRLLSRITELPDAILSPVTYWASDPGRIWSSGGKATLLTPFIRSRKHFDAVTEVEVVTGCAILVPTSAWRMLGGFDANYSMYFEDFDLALRAKGKGIRIFVVPDRELNVLHRVSGSFRGTRVWTKHYLMLTSTLIFIRTHSRGLRKALGLMLAGAHLAVTALVSLPELPRPKLLWTALVQGFSKQLR